MLYATTLTGDVKQSRAPGRQKTRPGEGAGFSAEGVSVSGGVARELMASLIVELGMQFACFVTVVFRVKVVRVGNVRMMGCLLVVAGGVGLGGRLVMASCVLVVRSSLPMMLYLDLMGHVVFC